jgi:hypothetical protein
MNFHTLLVQDVHFKELRTKIILYTIFFTIKFIKFNDLVHIMSGILIACIQLLELIQYHLYKELSWIADKF